MTGDVPSMLLKILPEIGMIILVGVVLIVDLVTGKDKPKPFGWIVFFGLLIILILSIFVSQPGSEPELIWGGMLRVDSAGFIFRLLFISAAALTSLITIDHPGLSGRGEFYALLLVSTLGMTLMASAADLIMIFLAIETTSMPLYILAGFLIKDKKSVESGLKYFLFGVGTSTVMLFGFSYIYGLTGTTQLYEIGSAMSTGEIPVLMMAGTMILVLVGFGFKISAVPFHFWAPDVYEGAPTPIAGFLSTASKAAGFAVLMRVLSGIYPSITPLWTILISVLAVASMVIGNFLALAQKNIKRLLAYSSIAQAGYMLIGVAAGTSLGLSAATYYLLAYLLTNIAAFGVVHIVGKSTGTDDISAYAGLSRRSPGLAFVMLIALLSLAGIPPFAGFIGKVLVFTAAMQADMAWLAILGVLNSIVALYYYLVIMKTMYSLPSMEGDRKIVVSRASMAALSLCMLGVILFGTIMFGYGFNLTELASLAFLSY